MAVRDIQIHPRERDLIIGTHGRGVWIIDDIRPLEGLTAEAVNADGILFEVKPATLFSFRSTVDNYSDAGYAGANRPFGAAVNYFLHPSVTSGSGRVRLAIQDKDGREVAAPFVTREAGLNRVVWNLRGGAAVADPAPGETRGGARRGMVGLAPFVLPGAYKAVLEVNGRTMEAPFEVLADPDQELTLDDRRAGQDYTLESQDLSRRGRELLQQIDSTGKQLADIAGRVASMKPPATDVAAKVQEVRDKVEAIKAVFFMSPPEQGFYRKPLFVAFRGGTAAELVTGAGRGSSGMGGPTQTAIDQLADLKAFAEPLFAKMKEIVEKDVPELNTLLAAKGVPYIK